MNHQSFRLRAFVFASLLASLVTACAGGHDVTLTPPAGQSSSAAELACTASPAEDVCGRSFDLPDDRRADVVAFIQSVALVAGQVDEVSARVFAACDAMAAELVVEAVGLPEDTPRQKKKRVCDAVGKAIFESTGGSTLIEVGPDSCAPLAAPTCAQSPRFQRPAQQRCDPPTVKLGPPVGPVGALGRAMVVNTTVVQHGSEILWADRQRASIFELLEAISNETGSLTSFQGDDPREPACISPAVKMLGVAIDDLDFAIQARGALPLSSVPDQ